MKQIKENIKVDKKIGSMARGIFINALMVMLGGCLLFMSGCGTPKEVPEMMIQYAIEDYIYAHGFDGQISYEYTTQHEWDKESNIDTVTVITKTEYSHGYIVAENILAYQYDKSSDNWYLNRDYGWTQHVEYKPEAYNNAYFEDGFTWGGINPGMYMLEIAEVDFDNEKIDLAYYETNAAYVDNDFRQWPACIYGEGTFNLNNDIGEFTTTLGEEVELPVMELRIEQDGCTLEVKFSVFGIYSTYIRADN